MENPVINAAKAAIDTYSYTPWTKWFILTLQIIIVFLIAVPVLYVLGLALGLVKLQHPHKASMKLLDELL